MTPQTHSDTAVADRQVQRARLFALHRQAATAKRPTQTALARDTEIALQNAAFASFDTQPPRRRLFLG